jgi:hypothetical protein
MGDLGHRRIEGEVIPAVYDDELYDIIAILFDHRFISGIFTGVTYESERYIQAQRPVMIQKIPEEQFIGILSEDKNQVERHEYRF